MIALLLISIESHVMFCVRVFLNFVMLVYYRSYDKRILKYIEYALNRIYKLKNIFRKCKVSKKTKKTKRSNTLTFSNIIYLFIESIILRSIIVLSNITIRRKRLYIRRLSRNTTKRTSKRVIKNKYCIIIHKR